MSCVVKLAENKFIQWSKASDSPASNVLSEDEMKQLVLHEFKVLNLMGQNPSYSYDQVIELILSTGSSDPLGIVTLEFILEYNRAGKNESQLSLAEIIEQYSS